MKWYDPAKGFGFVMVEGEAKDLFVHRSALERGGISSLAEGQAVRVSIIEGRKGREIQEAPLKTRPYVLDLAPPWPRKKEARKRL